MTKSLDVKDAMSPESLGISGLVGGTNKEMISKFNLYQEIVVAQKRGFLAWQAH